MKASRRFTDHKKAGHPLVLPDDHKAVAGNTTLFPSRVATPDLVVPLFKSGQNSRKIGSHVTKGMWRGMPIYTLTLEERDTCPRYCEHYNDCFGNKMHWSTRWKKGLQLQFVMNNHLAILAKKFPSGFVVRLHVLGDFYSAAYVELWERFLNLYPQIRVFGYTRWDRNSKIGARIDRINKNYPNRWVVRWSERGGEMGTLSKDDVTLRGKTPDGIVCPAQTGDSDCCGTCALCWNTTKPIVFITH